MTCSVEHVHARQILDSRGNLTLEELICSDGSGGRAAVRRRLVQRARPSNYADGIESEWMGKGG